MSSGEYAILKDKGYADRLRLLLNLLDLPTGELATSKYTEKKEEQLNNLLSVSGSSHVLKNWMKTKNPTPIHGDDLAKLINVIEKETGVKLYPFDIAPDAFYINDVTEEELRNINLSFIKGDKIQSLFINAPIDDICKLILYFDTFVMFDFNMIRFVIRVLNMSDRGKDKTKMILTTYYGFDDYINHMEMFYAIIVLNQKIKRNQIHNEVANYIVFLLK